MQKMYIICLILDDARYRALTTGARSSMVLEAISLDGQSTDCGVVFGAGYRRHIFTCQPL